MQPSTQKRTHSKECASLSPSLSLELPSNANDVGLSFSGKMDFGSCSPSPRGVETWEPTSPLDFDCPPRLDFLDFDLDPNIYTLLDSEADATQNIQPHDTCSPIATSNLSLANDSNTLANSLPTLDHENPTAPLEKNSSDAPLRLQLAYLEKVLNGPTHCFEGIEIGHLRDFGFKAGDFQDSNTSSENAVVGPISTATIEAKLPSAGASGVSRASKTVSKVGKAVSGRGKPKLNSEWAHLSEEELKKLRRVRNRASVEKCRTKQRLRMEALQIEMNVLTCENTVMRKTACMVDGEMRNICSQVGDLTGHQGRMQSTGQELEAAFLAGSGTGECAFSRGSLSL